jgi:hypothetical protein
MRRCVGTPSQPGAAVPWFWLIAVSWLTVALSSCADPGDDGGDSCMPPSSASSGPAYCGGICYLPLCCTESHDDCPDTMPEQGTCCSEPGVYCAYGCRSGAWQVAGCGPRGLWYVVDTHCDPPLYYDAGTMFGGDAGTDAGP